MKKFKHCSWCGRFFKLEKETIYYCGHCLKLPVDVIPDGKPYYVYQLAKPDKTPFYIGKGTVYDRPELIPRLYHHEYDARNDRKNTATTQVICDILESGQQVDYSILGFFANEADALDMERQTIQHLAQSGCLTNKRFAGNVSQDDDDLSIVNIPASQDTTKEIQQPLKENDALPATIKEPLADVLRPREDIGDFPELFADCAWVKMIPLAILTIVKKNQVKLTKASLRVGKSRSYLTKVVHREKQIKIEDISVIAQALNMTIIDLWQQAIKHQTLHS